MPGSSCEADVMGSTFTKFDPRAFLECGPQFTGTGETESPPRLAAFASLAGGERHPENQVRRGVVRDGQFGRDTRPVRTAAANPANPAKVRVRARLLRPVDTTWASEDWQARFDERASFAELDGGLSRVDAEHKAFQFCIAEWLNINPSPSPAGQCGWCGRFQTASA